MDIEDSRRGRGVQRGKLWFGFIAAAAAWVALGVIDILIIWQACPGTGHYSGEGGHLGARAISFAIAVVLLVAAVAAGATSYRNWRALSDERNLFSTEATDRAEFLAVLGVFVSFTLGIGIAWLSLPPLLIQLCERAK